MAEQEETPVVAEEAPQKEETPVVAEELPPVGQKKEETPVAAEEAPQKEEEVAAAEEEDDDTPIWHKVRGPASKLKKQDEDDIAEEWKDWKKGKIKFLNKPGDWKIFYDHAFRGHGSGFKSFQEAMISVSNGTSWDSKTQKPEFEVKDKARAWPVIGIYNMPAPDGTKRTKFQMAGYCDDNKKHGPGMLDKRKMQFATLRNTCMGWFEGIKGPKCLQWSSEGEIIEENMVDWFWQGDRL